MIAQNPRALLKADGIQAAGRLVAHAQRGQQHMGKQQGAGHSPCQRAAHSQPRPSPHHKREGEYRRGQDDVQPIGAHQAGQKPPHEQAGGFPSGLHGQPSLPCQHEADEAQGKQ